MRAQLIVKLLNIKSSCYFLTVSSYITITFYILVILTNALSQYIKIIVIIEIYLSQSSISNYFRYNAIVLSITSTPNTILFLSSLFYFVTLLLLLYAIFSHYLYSNVSAIYCHKCDINMKLHKININAKQLMCINMCVCMCSCMSLLLQSFKKRINWLVPRGQGISEVLQAVGTTCRNITHTLCLISDCVYAQPWKRTIRACDAQQTATLVTPPPACAFTDSHTPKSLTHH